MYESYTMLDDGCCCSSGGQCASMMCNYITWTCEPSVPMSPSVQYSYPPSPSTLLYNVPDHNQPWVYNSSITQRALCTPVAFASQLGAVVANVPGVEVPTGVPYPVAVPHGQQGWMDFAFEDSIPPGMWSDSLSWPTTKMAAFSWWMNTNQQGAADVPGGPPLNGGTFTESGLKGAIEFYARTNQHAQWGYAYHKNNIGVHGPRIPSTYHHSSGPGDPVTVWYAIHDTILAGFPVVLFLDSWNVNFVFSEYVYSIQPAQTNENLEEIYVTGDLSQSIGHTVVAVGFTSVNSCDMLIVQDNDHTTPKFVALPFFSGNTYCMQMGWGNVWDRLIATWYTHAP